MNLPTDSKERKEIPVVSGVLDYFPLAIAAVARVSYKGNEKHNPGQPLHWARSKSADHIDCVGRHLLDRDVIDKESGETELSHAAWRILAALQLQQESLGRLARKTRFDSAFVEAARRTDEALRGNDNCRDGRSIAEQKAGVPAGTIPKSYDGDWNNRSQSAGCWRIIGGSAYFIDRDSVVPAQTSMAYLKYEIDEGIKIPNRWPIPPAFQNYGLVPKPIAYISGPMRGYADFNFPAFDKAKAILEAKGFEVISPADMDRAQDKGQLQSPVVYADRDYAAIRRIAVESIPGSCVVTLHGYERSTGATAETAIAKWLGINIRSIMEFV